MNTRNPGRAGLSMSFAAFSLCLVSFGTTWDFVPTAAHKAALAKISADSLRGHLSFVASDILQGRATGSLGQDIAAEYVAAQFRRAGLKPVGGDGYYQTFPNTLVTLDPGSFRCSITVDGNAIAVPPGRFRVNRAQELQLEKAPIYKLPQGARVPDGVQNLAGSMVVTEFPAGADTSMESSARRQQFIQRVSALQPALLVELDRANQGESALSNVRSLKNEFTAARRESPGMPVITISDPEAVQALAALPDYETTATLSLHLETIESNRPLRNVVGLLPGSDPKLSDSYVLVTAHYDGTGPRAGSGADQIWNAANDKTAAEQ